MLARLQVKGGLHRPYYFKNRFRQRLEISHKYEINKKYTKGKDIVWPMADKKIDNFIDSQYFSGDRVYK